MVKALGSGWRYGVALLTVIALALFVAACGGGDDERDAALSVDGPVELSLPGGEEAEVEVPPKVEGDLADPNLEAAVEGIEEGEEQPDELTVRGDRVVVEAVVRDGAIEAVRDALGELEAVATGSVPPTLLQILIPAERLVDLESLDGVEAVRVPVEHDVLLADADAAQSSAAGAFVGEELVKTGAPNWHAAGHTGAGVKVGIIDYFDRTTWAGAQASGEVPAPAGTFCRYNGEDCASTWFWNMDDHGVGVAEIIHEMAPHAGIYLASVGGGPDLRAAIDYMAAQGVTVISRSLAGRYDGAGDGTGETADLINYANSRGITWINSAGNSAGRGMEGGYWRGTWRDADGDGFLDFPNGYEVLPVTCAENWANMRWSDWGPATERTDYDLYLYNVAENGGLGARIGYVNRTGEVFEGEKAQRLGDSSTELISCPSPGRKLLAAVKLFEPGSGVGGDTLELWLPKGWVGAGLHVNGGTAAQPASDSASPGAISVGAVGDDPMGTAIAPYSSEGPTNDNRIKPDLSAATCVKSFAYRNAEKPCFNGTSAATPVVAGAAALALGAGLASDPATLKSYLLGATVDRGTPGPDNVFGAGELRLPAPPVKSQGPAPDPEETKKKKTTTKLSRCAKAKKQLVKANQRIAGSLRGLAAARGAEERRVASRKLIRARAGRVSARAKRIGACAVRRGRR